jgi:transcriptional regulator with XRE-family HTH domain
MDLQPALTLRSAMNTAKKPSRTLGWAIRHVRKAQKRTLQYVALEVGSDPGNISRIERGAQDAPESLLKAIAAVLGLTMVDLWQVAESGHAGAARITAKAGKLPDAKRDELERYADFLLTQSTKD